MIKRIALAVVLACGAMAAPALAQTAAHAHVAASLSVNSTMGELKANPAALAILQRETPDIAASTQIPDAMTLRQIATYAPDRLPEAKLTAINAALAALPH